MRPGVLVLAAALHLTGAGAAQAEDLSLPRAYDAAQALLFNGRYTEATQASMALPVGEEQLAVYELRTSALHFQLRRAIGEPEDKVKAFNACAECRELVDAFMVEYRAGQSAAKAALRTHPNDPTTLFYLGKLDLSFVWLQLGTLGRRTGWSEYWEARHSLDTALEKRPSFVRARVARAWIDYIVDTRMPWGTGWLLGGGNRKKALAVMREAADEPTDFYTNAEALFGLWDMQLREKNVPAALETAHRLATAFPENPEVARFIAEHRR